MRALERLSARIHQAANRTSAAWRRHIYIACDVVQHRLRSAWVRAEALRNDLPRRRRCLALDIRAAMTTTADIVMTPAAMVLAAILPTAVILTCAWFAITVPYNLPRLEYAMDRWAGVEVSDSAGCFLGLIPGSRDVGGRRFSPGEYAPSDHKVIVLDDAPEVYWDVLVALENRGLGGWRTIPFVGIDWVSGIGAVRDNMMGHSRGATGLPQLVASSLILGDHGSQHGRWARKWQEFRYGAALYSGYWNSGDQSPFRALAASYLPHVRAARGSGGGPVIHGVGAASQVLWGLPAEDLALWQQAILASSVKRQILLAPEGDARGVEFARRIWNQVKSRAIFGLRAAYGETDSRVVEAIAQIEVAPLPEPHLCEGLENLLPDDPSFAFRLRYSLTRRAQYFAGEALSQAIAELRNTAGSGFHEAVAGITLTIDAASNMRFVREVRAALYEGPSDPAARMDILVAGADASGQIRFFHQPVQRALLNEPRATGSISKLIAAVALAPYGQSTDGYCNRRIDGILRNADGNTGSRDCGAAASWDSAHTAFALSHSLALFDALTRRRTRNIDGVMAASEFTPYPSTPTPTAISFGLGAMRPGDMIATMNAIGEGVDGRVPRSYQPFIIESIEWRDEFADRVAVTPQPTTGVVRLDEWLTQPSARAYAGEVLSAPLLPGATASRLGGCEARFDLAKTGTVARSGVVSSRLLLARGDVLGLPTAFLALSANPNPSEAAPATIGTTRLSNAICAGVIAATDNGG